METTTIGYLRDFSTAVAANTPAPLEIGATAVDMLHSSERLHHNQITFEIPSHHDLEHINKLHSFNTLLQRIGNVAYDTVASAVSGSGGAAAAAAAAREPHHNVPLVVDAAGQRITSEQISKSAVLNLAELKGASGAGGFLERFFEGADMHAIINYLWIGVVASLVILSVIFIVFSCYFYRKFREWKKCNKDIRSHLNSDVYPDGTLVLCDRLMTHGQAAADAAAYYQMESPPCYTIATGLPTYDEALHHHHQHFSYGMKFMYPSIAAVHHHPAIAGHHLVSTWEKEDAVRQHNSEKHQRKHQQQQQQHQQQSQQQLQQQQQSKRKSPKVGALEAPPAYDTADAAAAAGGVAAPLLGANEKAEAITICVAEMTAAGHKSDDACSGVVIA